MKAHSLAMILVLLSLSACRPQTSPVTGAELPARVWVGGVEFIRIPAGPFTFSAHTDPSHQKDTRDNPFRHLKQPLPDYYLARYEASAQDQARWMNADPQVPALLQAQRQANAEHVDMRRQGGCTVRSSESSGWQAVAADLPATDLSWAMADAMARWMGFRLPTEAEWQKAARGHQDQRLWPWGDEHPDDLKAHLDSGRHCVPVPVDALPEGASPYGLEQMAGNVSEPVADWYNHERDALLQDGVAQPPLATRSTPPPYTESVRISKGGRWGRQALHATIAMRTLVGEHVSRPGDGLRYALDAARVQSLLSQGKASTRPDHPSIVPLEAVQNAK